MPYADKYFDQDKNHILRAAQAFVEPQLLQQWVQTALATYQQLENPMGLEDDFILEIRKISRYDTTFLQEAYEVLSAIYRYKKGDNQLEIIWDGRSHYEVYAEEWSTTFAKWTFDLTQNPLVYRGILKCSVLMTAGSQEMHSRQLLKLVRQKFRYRFRKSRILQVG